MTVTPFSSTTSSACQFVIKDVDSKIKCTQAFATSSSVLTVDVYILKTRFSPEDTIGNLKRVPLKQETPNPNPTVNYPSTHSVNEFLRGAF